MNQLISRLLAGIFVDFQGELSLDEVRECLKDDNSREARNLLDKLNADQGVSDMMVTLADCLQDYIKSGINEDVVRDQIRTYSDS